MCSVFNAIETVACLFGLCTRMLRVLAAVFGHRPTRGEVLRPLVVAFLLSSAFY